MTVPTAARCIAAGKHIHLDKPAGESLAALRRLLDDATARRLTVQMGYMLRYNPAFELLFQAVREGWLGEITEIDAAMGKLAEILKGTTPSGTMPALKPKPAGAKS